MADAAFIRAQDDRRVVVAAAVAPGDCWQLADGRAAAYKGSTGRSSGDNTQFNTTGQYTFTKTAGIVLLDGGRAYWDHSANAVHYKKVNDRDFYLGRVVGDAASADTVCAVNINVDARYDLDLLSSPCLSVTVGTPAAGGLGYPVQLGGAWVLELDATSEAQKTDLLTRDGFDVSANAIVELAFLILSAGSNATQDLNLGIANGTHASDADSITQHLFVHVDGNSTNINLQSKDGTTTVASTDTTTDFTAGSAVAQRVEVWFDLRNPADVQVYVNGVNVLPSTVFNISAATGPLFLLAHLEKSSSTDVYKVAIDWLRARFAEQ